MDSIVLALKVVFPTFIMMSVGVFLQKIKMVDDHSLDVINKIVFRVFMSLTLFLNIYNMEINDLFTTSNLKLVGITIGSIFLIFFIAWVIFTYMTDDISKRGPLIQGSFRSNLIVFGIPMISSVYGDSKLGVVLVLIAPIVPIFNIMGVVLLEKYNSKDNSYKKLLISVMKNPLIVASTLAVLFLILGVRIPSLLMSTLVSMSKVATPLAFVVLGATLKFSNMMANIKLLAVNNFLKLFVFPALTLGLGIYMGFRYEYLVALLSVSASPVSVTSFNTVKDIGGDGKIAAEAVASSSVLSIATLFMWVFFLKHFSLI